MKYRKLRGYKYELAEMVNFKVPELCEYSANHLDYIRILNGNLTINESYRWDGASGPTVDTKDTMVAALAHDALYQLIREQLLPESERATADWILYRLLRENGMGFIRSLYFFIFVRIFGGSAIKRRRLEPQDIIYTT